MLGIGFWKTPKGFITHKQGLSQEQIGYLQNLKVGDRLVLWVNDVREGERNADLTLKRSSLPAEHPKVGEVTQNASV